MKTKFTQWNKMGDHPIVKENQVREFEYTELADKGCGFIEKFKAIHPGDYIVEINDVFVAVVSSSVANIIFEKN